MFILRYTKAAYGDGTGDLDTMFIEFDELKAAETFVKKIVGSFQYSNIMILVPLAQQMDYKEKFEELYDYILKTKGVREVPAPEPVVRPEARIIAQ